MIMLYNIIFNLFIIFINLNIFNFQIGNYYNNIDFAQNNKEITATSIHQKCEQKKCVYYLNTSLCNFALYSFITIIKYVNALYACNRYLLQLATHCNAPCSFLFRRSPYPFGRLRVFVSEKRIRKFFVCIFDIQYSIQASVLF